MSHFLSIQEAAQLTGLAPSTLYKRIATRSIPHLKLGTRVLFDPETLLTWVRSHAVITLDEQRAWRTNGPNAA